jgi:hypothetical protein
MEYFLIFILQVIGCGLHVAQKVLELDKKFHDDSLETVLKEFLKTDRVTLIISALVLALNIVVHYIVGEYSDFDEIEYYDLYSFGLAFVLGYAGQRLIYKYLGKAEEALNKKVESKL